MSSNITPDWFEFAPTAADWTAWLPWIFMAFGAGCVVVGIIRGIVVARRERRWFEQHCPSLTADDRGTMTVADLEEHRWRRQQQRLMKGSDGGDNAA